MIGSFRDLDVWQKSMSLVVRVYAATNEFPRTEIYGLAAQMRRAAVSIPSNIAEGKALGGQNYPRHLRVALGSESELETQIELARRLEMFDANTAAALSEPTCEVGRMLAGLLRSLPRD